MIKKCSNIRLILQTVRGRWGLRTEDWGQTVRHNIHHPLDRVDTDNPNSKLQTPRPPASWWRFSFFASGFLSSFVFHFSFFIFHSSFFFILHSSFIFPSQSSHTSPFLHQSPFFAAANKILHDFPPLPSPRMPLSNCMYDMYDMYDGCTE